MMKINSFSREYMNDDVQEAALSWKDRICAIKPWISPLYDLYNTFFRVDFKFEVLANNGNVDADPESAPINGAFSLIKHVTEIEPTLRFLSNFAYLLFIL